MVFHLKLKESYEVHSPMTEEEILEKLEKSRESAAKGNHKSAEVVVSELRGKYGL